MDVWLQASKLDHSLEEACKAAGVSLAVFLEGRLSDPGFEEACRVHDQIQDLKITEALRREAIKGSVAAMGLYLGRIRPPLLGPDAPGHMPASRIFTPEDAETLVQEGLDNLGNADDPNARPMPSLASSRPDSPKSRESRPLAKPRKSGPSG